MTGARIAVGVLVVWSLAAAGCSSDVKVESTQRRAEPESAALDRARSSVGQLAGTLMDALGEQLGVGTAAEAITVCSEIAPATASEISREGVEIRRTSLRYRNPQNAPDDWERGWLMRFDESAARGELPEDIHEIDRVRGELRYLRPILVAPGCLQCHGAEADLDPAVREQLARSYPDDKATGFSIGDLRGAFSVRVRL